MKWLKMLQPRNIAIPELINFICDSIHSGPLMLHFDINFLYDYSEQLYEETF